MNNKTIKTKYLPPLVEVIEVENEGGVMIASVRGFEDGGDMTRSVRSANASSRHSTSTLGELEDLINDILTIEK